MEQFDNAVSNALSVIDDNPYVSSALSLFLILYASLAAPQLPEYIADWFDNPIFKLVIFFLIAYSAQKNATVAIVAALAVMVTLQTLTRLRVNKQMVSMVAAEEAAAEEAAAEEAAMAEEAALAEEAAMAEQNEEEVIEGLDVESEIGQEDGIPEGAMDELQAEEGASVDESMEPPAGRQVENGNGGKCVKHANYRNSFYPQYVNMKPNAYDARYTGNDVNGYDSSAAYASI